MTDFKGVYKRKSNNSDIAVFPGNGTYYYIKNLMYSPKNIFSIAIQIGLEGYLEKYWEPCTKLECELLSIDTQQDTE